MSSSSVIAQYVVVRGDLIKKMGWNVGSVIAQAVHASVASIHLHYGEETTQRYLKEDLDGMTTVVLEVNSEQGLRNLSAKLKEASVDHKVWVEQPENYPTCLATRPYPKAEVGHIFKKYQLYKGPKLAVEVEKKEEKAKDAA